MRVKLIHSRQVSSGDSAPHLTLETFQSFSYVPPRPQKIIKLSQKNTSRNFPACFENDPLPSPWLTPMAWPGPAPCQQQLLKERRHATRTLVANSSKDARITSPISPPVNTDTRCRLPFCFSVSLSPFKRNNRH